MVAIKEIRDFLSLRRSNLVVIKICLRSGPIWKIVGTLLQQRNERIGFGRGGRVGRRAVFNLPFAVGCFLRG